MAKTANDLVQAAVRNTKYIAYDEVLEGDEYQKALDEYINTHNRLLEDSIHQWGSRRVYWSYNNVPDEVWMSVASVVAEDMLKHFPASDQAKADVKSYAVSAETRLKKHLLTGRSKQPRYPSFPV